MDCKAERRLSLLAHLMGGGCLPLRGYVLAWRLRAYAATPSRDYIRNCLYINDNNCGGMI